MRAPRSWKLPPVVGGAVKRKALWPGEPFYVPMNRYYESGAYTLHGNIPRLKCCGCGFVHVMGLTLFRADSGRWWLQIRAFAEEATRPHKVIRKAPPKKKPRRRR
jgi:hypothetical protein